MFGLFIVLLSFQQHLEKKNIISKIVSLRGTLVQFISMQLAKMLTGTYRKLC